MQIHTIITSLNTVATTGGMAVALAGSAGPPVTTGAGFVGGLHHGTRAAKGAAKPFGLISCEEIDSEGNSSGVKLVTYIVTLTVVVDQEIEKAGPIMDVFHRYWDRLVDLPDLNPDNLASPPARFILIHPTPTPSEIGEADHEDLGKDVLLGVTSWLLKLSEHQPELE